MATNAIETAKQENGSKLFFQSVIEQNKEPTSGEMKKVYEGYGAEWRDTYRKQTNALKKFLSLKPGKLELVEGVEMLRFVENGIKVKMVEVKDDGLSVDTPKDISFIENFQYATVSLFLQFGILINLIGKSETQR